jgi:hypothetical protein
MVTLSAGIGDECPFFNAGEVQGVLAGEFDNPISSVHPLFAKCALADHKLASFK